MDGQLDTPPPLNDTNDRGRSRGRNCKAKTKSDVGADTLTIDERFCRGDWGAPKSESSNATIPVNRSVIERIHRLKLLTVQVAGGGPGNKAVRKYRVVK